jgi:transcriptional regulator with XRE-family HTH domain
MENLSTVLGRLVAEKGISSAELARKTGVSQPVVHRLIAGETENPQILSLKPLADYFGISLDQLLGYAPLNAPKSFDNALMHSVTSKLSTIKTVASILIDLLPGLIDGYQKAVAARLVDEVVSNDILPLLALNTENLLKTANQIHELLMTNNNVLQE